MTRVLVLGGGPDAERDISITSAKGVHRGCLDAGLDATLLIVGEPDLDEIRSWDTEVVFPVLHGQFGEGGTLQHRLAQVGLPFVGTGFAGSALAMDKLGTKLIASGLGIPTPHACVLDGARLLRDGTLRPPFEPPLVAKPVHDGSSMGLHICKAPGEWEIAVRAVRADLRDHPQRVYMIERFSPGRELTAPVIVDPQNPGELMALPLIEISPKDGVYDYDAKYTRDDTIYRVNPELPEFVVREIRAQALALCEAIGVRHLARVDFILTADDKWTLLELNTMPGFTPTSLLPQAADAIGLPMPMLCAHLVRAAMSDDPGHAALTPRTRD